MLRRTRLRVASLQSREPCTAQALASSVCHGCSEQPCAASRTPLRTIQFRAEGDQDCRMGCRIGVETLIEAKAVKCLYCMELWIEYQLIAILEFDTIRHNSTLFAGLSKLSNWAWEPPPWPSPGRTGRGEKCARLAIRWGKSGGATGPKLSRFVARRRARPRFRLRNAASR
jgi:hypothetical protein